MTTPIPNCPQGETPWRPRAYTPAQQAAMDQATAPPAYIARIRDATDTLLRYAHSGPHITTLKLP